MSYFSISFHMFVSTLSKSEEIDVIKLTTTLTYFMYDFY